MVNVYECYWVTFQRTIRLTKISRNQRSAQHQNIYQKGQISESEPGTFRSRSRLHTNVPRAPLPKCNKRCIKNCGTESSVRAIWNCKWVLVQLALLCHRNQGKAWLTITTCRDYFRHKYCLTFGHDRHRRFQNESQTTSSSLSFLSSFCHHFTIKRVFLRVNNR